MPSPLGGEGRAITIVVVRGVTCHHHWGVRDVPSPLDGEERAITIGW